MYIMNLDITFPEDILYVTVPSPVFPIPLLLNYTQGLLFCHTKAYLEVSFTFLFFHSGGDTENVISFSF